MILFLPRARIFLDTLDAADADQMASIHSTAFARGWSSYEIAQLLSGKGVFGIGIRHESAFRGRRLVGFVLMRTAADEAEVLTLAVRPSNRGRGMGRQLMEEALRHLYHDRIASCFLEVDAGNASAIGLYKALGFATVGERKGYYANASDETGGALVMRLKLDSRGRREKAK